MSPANGDGTREEQPVLKLARRLADDGTMPTMRRLIGDAGNLIHYAGVAAGAGLIGWEHHLVKPGDLSRLDAAFFTANGIVSIVVFLGALVDRVV